MIRLFRGSRRRKLITMLLLALAAIIIYLLAVVLANRFRSAPAVQDAVVSRAPGQPLPLVPDGSVLRIMTWNIGYAGMGHESDFVADGGVQSRPLSRELVDRNLAGIVSVLRDAAADVYMIEEAAAPSWFTYQTDVLQGVVTALAGYDWLFGADFSTRLVPPPWKTGIGNAIFSRFRIASASRLALPLEPTFVMGTFRKIYRMHVARLPLPSSDRSLVLISVHVAAFDKDAEVRLRQLRDVIAFASREHSAGNPVIIGGDFNLRLARTEFPNTTEPRHLFWLHDWPPDLTPPGWTLAFDPARPTNRTAYKPYVAGENYTSIIDGFLCSPGIHVRGVHTQDLGFQHTDHNPVILELSLPPPPQQVAPDQGK